MPFDAGEATVAGLDVRTQGPALREKIGLAGQYAAVDEQLTGHENLTMVGRLYGMAAPPARTRADELLEQFDLVDAGGRVVRTYSGGMRRRLDLAAALVATPPVLFLDEPTTGLDPRSRLSLWDTIEELVGGGTTVLLTTQYLDEADRLADDIAVIDHGKVIASGTPSELKDRVGGERIEVTLIDPAAAATAVAALAPMADDEPLCEEGVVSFSVQERSGAIVRAVQELVDGGRRGRRHRRPPAHARRRVPVADRPGRGMRRLLRDTLIIAQRNLRRMVRQPDLIAAFTIQPIMFVLLFVYVFGGAIQTPGLSYKDFLIPGIIVQNVAFSGFVTALGLNEDLSKGLIDRFRSLPMSRPAVLAGRTASDLVTTLLSIVVLLITGLIIGFRFQTSVPEILGGVALMLLFGYAFSWVFALLGMLVKSPEAANSVGFIAVFPLTFISSAFVPTDSMPDALQAFADVNPFTILVNAMRALWVGTPAENYVWGGVVWSLVILAVFAPLAILRYRRKTAQ